MSIRGRAVTGSWGYSYSNHWENPHMAKSRSLHQAVRFALTTAAAAAGVSTLHAQTAPAPAAPIEEVVVTGSRLSTPNERSISPITSVSATDLQSTGLTRVEDVLNNLPMVFAGQNATVSNGADGTASVDLRGLGPQRTLVLVNGRRLGPGFSDGRNYSDINQIPAPLIERVDILTGGASSVYGADAVAGVVNFILNTRFQGVRVDAGYNFNQHHNSNAVASLVSARNYPLPSGNVDTGFGKTASIVMGSNFAEDRGNATVYATFDHAGAILQSKYDYSACTLDAAGNTALACGGSSTSAHSGTLGIGGGRFLAFPSAGGPALFSNTVDANTGQFRKFVSATDAYNFGPLNFYQRPNERWTAGGFLNYDISPHLSPYAEVSFTRNTSDAQIAPSGSFGVFAFIPCNDPLLTAQEQSTICSPANLAAQGNPNPAGLTISVLRRNAEGGGRVASFDSNSFRTVAGIKGDIGEAWRFDVSGQRGTLTGSNQNLNYLSNANIANALDVVPGPGGAPTCQSVISGTDPACVPWNIWVPGGVTAAATKYLSIPLLVEGDVTEQVVSGSLTGDIGKYGVKLPSADQGLQFNIGAEWRSEAADFRPDLESQLGNAAGSGGPTVPVSGNFHVKEVFTEVRMPLADHVAAADSLALEGGYRYSDYSLGFHTNTYKLGLEWAPVRDLRARGSYQRAVRAPNIGELYTPQSVALDGSTDPCAGPTPAASQADCVFAGVSAAQYGNVPANSAQQYNGLLGGNPKLQPEPSDTYSVGFVVQPRVVPNLSISVDYFNIRVKETIGAIGADIIISNCLATHDPAYCSAIHRDATGSLWLTNQGYISDTDVNFGSLSTKGFDIKGSYRVNIGTLGSLSFGLEGTKLNSLNTQPLTGGPTYDCTGFFGVKCGASDPSWRHVFNMTWSTPWSALDVGLRWRYLGSVNSEQSSSDPQLAGTPSPVTQRIPAYNYLDLQGQFSITKAVRVQLGVNNLTDKDPPIVQSGGGLIGSDCPTITPNLSSCNGNTWPGTYDALGRYIFARMTAQF
jgi:iron complex outermembrane recepter protein